MMLFFTSISHAQIMGDVEADNDKRKLTSVQMENAIMLYDKMTASADYIEWQELTKKIYSIANKESNANSFIYNEENRNEKKIKTIKKAGKHRLFLWSWTTHRIAHFLIIFI